MSTVFVIAGLSTVFVIAGLSTVFVIAGLSVLQQSPEKYLRCNSKTSQLATGKQQSYCCTTVDNSNWNFSS